MKFALMNEFMPMANRKQFSCVKFSARDFCSRFHPSPFSIIPFSLSRCYRVAIVVGTPR